MKQAQCFTCGPRPHSWLLSIRVPSDRSLNSLSLSLTLSSVYLAGHSMVIRTLTHRCRRIEYEWTARRIDHYLTTRTAGQTAGQRERHDTHRRERGGGFGFSFYESRNVYFTRRVCSRLVVIGDGCSVYASGHSLSCFFSLISFVSFQQRNSATSAVCPVPVQRHVFF